MKTTYENRLDILDYALPHLRAIAHLYDCMFTYADTVGTNTQSDLEVGDLLSSLLRDITEGIKQTLEKELEEDKSKKCKS